MNFGCDSRLGSYDTYMRVALVKILYTVLETCIVENLVLSSDIWVVVTKQNKIKPNNENITSPVCQKS